LGLEGNKWIEVDRGKTSEITVSCGRLVSTNPFAPCVVTYYC